MDARPELVARLRADLLAADFTVARLETLWGAEAGAALARSHRVPARRALDLVVEFDPAAVLARLFVLGLPVAVADAAMALPSVELAGAVQLGICRWEGEAVAPTVDLRPYSFVDEWGLADWWLASDLGELALGSALPPGHVLGLGGASLTLAGLQLGRPADLALDLGTGCGIQALHASRHSGRVIATDISHRALDYAKFNAALNEISNVEFRQGDLYEPVSHERFDYIVSNPPFVITPRGPGIPQYEYRDGGRVGDALVAEVIAGAARRLRPGGIALLLGNWEYHSAADPGPLGDPDEDGLARVGETIVTAGLDGWVVEREVQDAPLYAQTWIRDGGTRPGTEADRLEDAWLDDFRDRRVTAVGFGYVVLRAPAGGDRAAALHRLERLTGPVAPGLGGHLASTLDAFDWQASLDDSEFAKARLVVARDVTEERHYWPGDEHPAVMNLKQGGGFARSYPLDTVLAAVVGACDGELSVGAICAAVSELLEADERQLLAEVLPALREFVTVGILQAGLR